ncbi:MAG: kgd, partial [Cryptosporangiaceae bacterium]|nr:kgd [Cryptosporangiaceae bacterium]
MSTQSPAGNPLAASFGPNEWIVEEIYQQFLADPASVDPAWHDFFTDYKPEGGGEAAKPAAPPAENGRQPEAPTGTAAVADGIQATKATAPAAPRPGTEPAAQTG